MFYFVILQKKFTIPDYSTNGGAVRYHGGDILGYSCQLGWDCNIQVTWIHKSTKTYFDGGKRLAKGKTFIDPKRRPEFIWMVFICLTITFSFFRFSILQPRHTRHRRQKYGICASNVWKEKGGLNAMTCRSM